MMHWMGQTRRVLAIGMLAAVLLSGCGSTGDDLPASSIQLVEEETQEETMAQELQKQIVAVLNVSLLMDGHVTSNSAMEQAADFFLDCLLQDPDIDPAKVQNPTKLNGMLTSSYNCAFVYDGELSAVQAGRKILEDLKILITDPKRKYQTMESIAIVHGGQGEKSAWLVLILYSEDDGSEDTEENSGKTEHTNPGETEDSETEPET